MSLSRRQMLMTTLFGAGGIGVRALATGLPAAFLLNPRKALADMPLQCASPAKAQYFILSTSGGGDPINASAPGTYEDANIVHSPSPLMAATALTMAGRSFTAGKPWATLPQNVLDRTVFWHLMTNTPVHPREPEVLRLMGSTTGQEMLPSLLAKAVAPCLKTVQTRPIAVGASGPGEALSYDGETMPIIPPVALKDTLTNPAGPLTQLQALRDQTMNQLYDLYKNGATPTQRAYMDQMITTQQQVRALNQSLLSTLASIKDNGPASQILAAITLIQLNVAPVISIHIPFGGDNHSDAGLAKETSETVAGVASLVSLMAQLASAGLEDKVTFMSLNVFGRTLGPGTANGRAHNEHHQVSLTIGKPFKGGVIGACAPVKGDYGATPIDSKTGMGSASGDVSAVATLGAFGKTILSAVGGDPSSIAVGATIAAALA